MKLQTEKGISLALTLLLLASFIAIGILVEGLALVPGLLLEREQQVFRLQ